ncbi:MAG: flagellar export protein FliJ [Limnohabitans sp.]
MKARECWTVLLGKAQRQVQEAQTSLARLQQTHQSLEQSLARVEQLYKDYSNQAGAHAAAGQGMHDALNQRQFLSQLGQLRARLADELQKAAQARQAQRQALIDAERERMKMQSLVDEDLQRQQRRADAREQKGLDELGLRQFNLQRH